VSFTSGPSPLFVSPAFRRMLRLRRSTGCTRKLSSPLFPKPKVYAVASRARGQSSEACSAGRLYADSSTKPARGALPLGEGSLGTSESCLPCRPTDYWRACICVSPASRGEPEAFFESSYRIYGKHPDKVWPHILATRKAKHTRKAKLGEEFRKWYDAAGNRKPDIPKKKPVCPRLASGFGCSCSPGGKAQVS